MLNPIKYPSILRYGYRYEIKKPSSVRYRYAEPKEYVDKLHAGECWIVDNNGNVDPKLADSLVVLSANMLKNGIPCESQSHKSVSLVLEGGEKNDKPDRKRNKKRPKENRRRLRRKQKTS